jgi:hypothetical protein
LEKENLSRQKKFGREKINLAKKFLTCQKPFGLFKSVIVFKKIKLKSYLKSKNPTLS